MTEEEIKWNIAIAEFTGEWKNCRYFAGGPYEFEDIVGTPLLVDDTWVDYEDSIPYWYHKDLNAIYEVEIRLPISKFDVYFSYLEDIIMRETGCYTNYDLLRCSASEKAEALYKMIEYFKSLNTAV